MAYALVDMKREVRELFDLGEACDLIHAKTVAETIHMVVARALPRHRCSYAAVALACSMFREGANSTAAMAFQFARN